MAILRFLLIDLKFCSCFQFVRILKIGSNEMKFCFIAISRHCLQSLCCLCLSLISIIIDIDCEMFLKIAS